MQRSLKIGVIGCGFIASEVHLPVLEGLHDVVIVGACDRDENRLKHYASLADLGDGGLFQDHRQLLWSTDLDCVLVATPPSSHKAIVADCLNAGVGVLCEKPMAMSGGDALEMLAASSQSRYPLGVISNFLEFPEIACVKQVIAEASPKFPRLLTIRGRGLGMDAAVIQEYLSGNLNGSASCDSRGGVLRDYGVHAVYVANHLLGGVPRAVTCVLQASGHPGENVDTSALCMLEYPTSHAVIDLSWEPRTLTEDHRFQRGSLDIAYDDSLVEVNYAGRGDGLHAHAGGVSVYDRAGETIREMPAVSQRERLFGSFHATFSKWFSSGMFQKGPDETARSAAGAMVVISACEEADRARGTVLVDWPRDLTARLSEPTAATSEGQVWQS